MSNTYGYGMHRNLTPSELLFLIAVDETCDELGVNDAVAVASILAGQNWLPTRVKPMGATPGTSVASKLSRRFLDYDIKWKILPTVTNGSVKQLKFLMARNIGKFVGRTVPVVGWAIAAHDAMAIGINSVRHYNRLVKQEDRIS
ncbi:STM2901 family protein [Caballeronia pedi]|uniref:STM2901 family protein n=1 Tax=Caballeronia pedi TaxID=1777141 RepID=UPI00077292EC|nr:hypothetical protein [Caballeronia pedi]